MIEFFNFSNIKKSLLAGILIGLGVIINLQATNSIVGALLFSFGLLTIIAMQLFLFTGKVGYIHFQHSRISFIISVLFFNCIGIAATIGLYALSNPIFIDTIINTATLKFSKSIFTLFINAFFCGMLIHFAVKNKINIITIFSVMIFILIGAEHCIADFPYLLFNFSLLNFIKFILIIAGNSLGAIFIEELSNNNEISQ